MTLSNTAYARLLALRTGLRHFERWSERQARAAGLTPAQHQLLLAVRGHGDRLAPTIGEVADYLLLRHHSVVGLVDRAEAAGLVYRLRDGDDHRIVRLYLTDEGAERLEALSALHLEELDRLALQLPEVWAGLAPVQRPHGFAGPLADASQVKVHLGSADRHPRKDFAKSDLHGGKRTSETKSGKGTARVPRRA
ncbi:MAG: MarR family winged helix-turn-helix transcriptional regulator [Actinobacteria bacterium]|nr:MarR family winged helix-turn-helix transcriptional regulator [Actinomycetota bacterium]